MFPSILSIVLSRSELRLPDLELSNDPTWIDVTLEPSAFYDITFRIAVAANEASNALVFLFEVEDDDDQQRNSWGSRSTLFGRVRYRYLPAAYPDGTVTFNVTGPATGRVRIGLRAFRNKATVAVSPAVAVEQSETDGLRKRMKASELYLEHGTSSSMSFASSIARRMTPKRILNWLARIDWISAKHQLKTGKKLNLFRPVLFSEKMQWRKLFDNNPIYSQLTDKIAVQSHIKSCGHENLLIPTLWTGTDPRDMPFSDLPRPFIIKSTHASRHTIVVKEQSQISFSEIISKCDEWLKTNFGEKNTVAGYVHVPKRLIVEPLLTCSNGAPPPELLVFVFNGTAQFCEYITTSADEKRQSTVAYMSREWDRLEWKGRAKQFDPSPERPAAYERVLRVAERLCQKVDHCRADFYLIDDDVFIGELTPYSWAGWPRLKPPEVDLIMGSFWTLKSPAARAIWAILFKRWGEA